SPQTALGETVTDEVVTIAEKTVPIAKPRPTAFGLIVAGVVLVGVAALGLWFWSPWKDNGSAGVRAAAEAAWKDSFNLLTLIDPQKDVVSGQWKQDGTSWASDATGSFKGGAALLQLPYQPPEEYDYRITFTRLAGDGSIMQIVSRAGKNFGWVLRAERMFMGFERAGNKRSWAENPSTVRVPNALPVGSRHTSIVQVRKNGLTAYLDGQLVVRWPTDYTDFMGAPNQLRDPTLLGMGSWQNPVIFHSAEIREVTGKGVFTRGAPAGQH
ncbi:MAG: hypothetical protein NTY53_00690, partial [Kiritimatiellaeota bacterium]|nr:hypothetical protein [Kiritimatiellota bacterium]